MTSGRIYRICFPKHGSYPSACEPSTLTVPVARGQMQPQGQFAIIDGDTGQPVLCQGRPVSLWEDGSVRLLHTVFCASLPSQIGVDYSTCRNFLLNRPVKKEYRLELGGRARQWSGTGPGPVGATDGAGGITIENGLLQVVVAPPGSERLFARCATKHGLAVGAEDSFGPDITDSDGAVYSPRTDSFELIEEGPVRVWVRLKGRHHGPAGTLLDFEMNVRVYAGVEWIDCDYRLLNGEGRDVALRSICTGWRPQFAGDGAAAVTRAGKAHGPYGKTVSFLGEHAEPVRLDIDQAYATSFHQQGSPFCFFGDAYAAVSSRDQGGLMATVLQPVQNYPKAFTAGPEGLTIHLKPGTAPVLTLREGMALLQSYLLWFHPPETTTEQMAVRGAMYSYPERPFLEPWVYDQTDVFAEKLDFRPGNSDVENYLYDSLARGPYGMGMLNWPDYAWTTQGAQGGEAGIAWANCYYDYPMIAHRTALRVGSTEAYEAFLASGRHLLHVDIAHRLRDRDHRDTGGMYCIAPYHASGHPDQAWMWINGTLDYYHATGDPFALEKALGLGRCEERLLERNHWDGGSPRQSATPIRIFSMLYYETHDPRWLALADRMVAVNAKRIAEWGTIDEPTVQAVTTGRKTFMMGVLALAYYYYYRCTGRPAGKEYVERIARDVINANLTHAGQLVYIDGSAGSRGWAGPLPMHAPAAAYDLTGNADLLRAILPCFRKSLQLPPASSEAVIVFDNGHYSPGFGGALGLAHNGPSLVKLYAGLYDAGLVDADLDFVWHLEGSGYHHPRLEARHE